MLTDCDYQAAGTFRSMAWVVVDGRDFVVLHVSGYESSDWELFELTGDSLEKRLSVFAGGC